MDKIEIPKEIYDSLMIINSFCWDHPDCVSCPFNDDGDCPLFERTPNTYHKHLEENDGKYYYTKGWG